MTAGRAGALDAEQVVILSGQLAFAQARFDDRPGDGECGAGACGVGDPSLGGGAAEESGAGACRVGAGVAGA